MFCINNLYFIFLNISKRHIHRSDQNECSLTNILPLIKLLESTKINELKIEPLKQKFYLEIMLLVNKPHPSGGESLLTLERGEVLQLAPGVQALARQVVPAHLLTVVHQGLVGLT